MTEFIASVVLVLACLGLVWSGIRAVGAIAAWMDGEAE